uniref:ATP synthase subunit a n=1 Tax=Zecheuna tonkinensis TaxID=2844956 RepID=A0A8H2SN08_9HEMI|nr:ATP synthase F0 subunit 6 [Zecheuna tonkinensis]
MMASLFSSFDPSSKMFQMNWMMMISPMIMLPMKFWMKKSRWTKMKKKLEKKISMEIMNNTKHKEMLMMSMSMFYIIMINNMMGLFPYNFTSTSHPSISISLALPMWMMLMMYGWMKFTKSMLIHLLPTGTPNMIMPMMIIIEITGNIIRPMSLSIRLTANMIAGHLMMTLLGNMNQINKIIFILPIQMGLMSFETAISIIQAYVFMTLISLYSSEIP